MLAVEVRGLTRTYGPYLALHQVNLAVEWGQTLVVLGPNGSGKTTLVKVLAGLARPTEGWAQVAGFPLHTHPLEVQRRVGVLTHNPFLYADLTVWENLLFYARMFGLQRPSARIETLADRLGLTERLHQRVRTLSHGLQKRAGLARALLHQPPVLLLDEPEAGLDAPSVATLEQVIREHCEHGGAVVLTTHQVAWGLALGHQAVALHRGRVALAEPHSRANAATFQDAYRRLMGVQGG
ncbi:MAG: heme ABC exporter ATP-binding protein CcmA [Dehalococcoidia bacterium]|nr:heme ABC exporter ATP-binding protein CcmA [Dehalococcoidia bacterium]MDW8120156.1 heme ABC exporter ATP-binding protein CcmA [Chloroflexota bacterium]